MVERTCKHSRLTHNRYWVNVAVVHLNSEKRQDQFRWNLSLFFLKIFDGILERGRNNMTDTNFGFSKVSFTYRCEYLFVLSSSESSSYRNRIKQYHPERDHNNVHWHHRYLFHEKSKRTFQWTRSFLLQVNEIYVPWWSIFRQNEYE